jgi:hypothetical protein
MRRTRRATCFTCFIGTKVQILTRRKGVATDEADASCYPEGGDYRMTRIGADMKCRVDAG